MSLYLVAFFWTLSIVFTTILMRGPEKEIDKGANFFYKEIRLPRNLRNVKLR